MRLALPFMDIDNNNIVHFSVENKASKLYGNIVLVALFISQSQCTTTE